MISDFDKFEKYAGLARTTASLLLEEFFGEKCDVYSESCPLCQRWKLLDQLLENPFDKEVK